MKAAFLFASLLLAGALAAQQASSPAQPANPSFRISGTVVSANGGQPLADARLSLQSVAVRNAGTASADGGTWTTSADGRGQFAFEGLPPGKYALAAEARGFILQSFDQHENFSSAIVAGPGLLSEGLVFRLKPDAAIAVKVRDEFDEPVRNGSVTLFEERLNEGEHRIQVRTQTALNDNGTATFAHLPSGKYFVAVSAQPWYAQPYPQPGDSGAATFDVAYPITYYGNVTEPSAAKAIRLRPGERMQGDITLTAVPCTHLTITSPAEASGTNLSVRLEQPSLGGHPLPLFGHGMWRDQNGIQVMGVPPGHYLLHLESFTDQKPSTRTQEINLAGTMVIDASAPLPAPAISGHIVFEGMTGAPPQSFLQLVDLRSGRGEVGAPVSPTGDFEIGNGLQPGTYQVRIFNNLGFVAKSVSANGGKARGTTIEIPSTDTLRVSVAASRELGRVEGVALRNQQPLAGAMVVLVPRDPAANLDRFRRDQSDSDGSFTLPSVLPGDYTVIAVSNWNLEWANPAALRPYLIRGRNLHVAGNGKYDPRPQVQ